MAVSNNQNFTVANGKYISYVRVAGRQDDGNCYIDNANGNYAYAYLVVNGATTRIHPDMVSSRWTTNGWGIRHKDGGNTGFNFEFNDSYTFAGTPFANTSGGNVTAQLQLRCSAGSLKNSGSLMMSLSTQNIPVSACGAPTSVTIAYIGNGKVRVTWSGASGGTSNSITSYHVGIATSSGGSFAQSTTITTSATSGTAEFTVNNTTAYYGAVRTQGSAGSAYYSAYKWSSNTAQGTGTHPTVSVGSIITKAQMDTLRSYKGSGTAATQGAAITASLGSTYSSVSAGTTINASWYNNA